MKHRILTTLIALAAMVMTTWAEGVKIGSQALTPTTTTTYTSSNLSAIQSGSVTYNPTNNTLTLNNASIRVPLSTLEGAIVFSSSGTLVLTGTNTITATENGVQAGANLTISGSGNLTCTSTNCGIYVTNGATLTISGGCTVTANGAYGIAGNPTGERLVINNANVSATGSDGSICDFDYMNPSAYLEKAIELTGVSIAAPEGAKLNSSPTMAVVDAQGSVIKGQTVVIRSDYTDSTTGLVFSFKTMNGSVKAVVKGHTDGLPADLEIPSQITAHGEPFEVGAIGVSALNNCSNLESVVIPATVTEIGSGAFYNCANLRVVSALNPTPVTIDATTFNLSNKPNNATYEMLLQVPLGCGARYSRANYWKQFRTTQAMSTIDGCTYMEDINGNASVKRYESSATTFNIPASLTVNGTTLAVTQIARESFSSYTCPNLQSISIPASVTDIESGAFYGCQALRSITVASGNPVYDSREGCNAIIETATNTLQYGYPSTTIPQTVTSIAASAFAGYGNSLTSITIPSSVTRIGYSAFYKTKLNSIYVKAKLPPTLDGSVFDEDVYSNATLKVPTPEAYREAAGWQDFAHIEMGATVTSGDFVFTLDDDTREAELTQYKGTAANVVIPSTINDGGISYSVTSIGKLAFMDNYQSNTTMQQVTIPSTVTTIGEQAFASCSALTTVTIPASVTSIGLTPFFSCRSLTSLTVASGNTKYDSREGCNAIIETATNTLVAGIATSTIPSTVTAIGDYAFYMMPIASIVIPGSVKTIGQAAFIYCSYLTSVTLSEGLETIGQNAFDGCEALESINIPSTTTSISTAFSGTGLTSVVIPISISSLDDYAFDRCSDLTSITLSGSMTSIGTGAFRYCEKLRTIDVLTPTPPTMGTDVFGQKDGDEFGIYGGAVVRVPEGSIPTYQAAPVWEYFSHFDILPLPKCATPTIAFANGKLTLGCATEGVEFVTNVSVAGAGQFQGNTIALSSMANTYTISVYAMKDGYLNSDIATTEIEVTPSAASADVNGDGKVTIADVTALVNVILGK